MYDMMKADEIYNKHLELNPHFDHMLVMSWREEMPEQFAECMYVKEYGKHIMTEDMYNEAIEDLEWVDSKGSGAKWKFDDIMKLTSVDFEKVKYSKYDYAYVVNMLYSDYANVFTEPSYYLRMAKNYLEDIDYPGRPCERAYKIAIKRKKHNKVHT